MKYIFKCLYFIPLLLLLTGCGKIPAVSSGKINNVVAVYFHEGNRFSIATKRENVIDINRLSTTLVGGDENGIVDEIKIYSDVPHNIPMYVDYRFYRNNVGMATVHFDIHIHDTDDINTAGWNHGKFGRGNTQRID